MRSRFVLVICIISIGAPPALAKQKDPLQRAACIVGDWTGVGEGEPGVSASARRTARAHGGRFIVAEGRSVYPKQERNPSGEVHTSTDIWSYDRERDSLIMRQFDNLGFVTTYVEDKSVAESGLRLVAEYLENVPKGWRARYTYQCVSENEYREMLELDSGDGFAPYVTGKFLRD